MKKKQFLVIGMGRFGSALSTTLYKRGHEVVVVDKDEAAIEAVMNYVTHAVIADATDQDALSKIGVGNFDTVVVSVAENLEANVLATVAAKSLGAKRVISKVASDLAAKVLVSVGADKVLQPERDMGVQLADQLSTPSIIDAFKLGDEHSVIEVEVQRKLCGELHDLRLSNRFGVQVIAINRGEKLQISPPADFELKSGDTVVLIGSNDAIEKLRSYLE